MDLKSWVTLEKCDVVACESTSDFWVPIYNSLKNYLPVIVGNARDMKASTHKKTDKIDSEVIAKLALHSMVQPPRVFPKDHHKTIFEIMFWSGVRYIDLQRFYSHPERYMRESRTIQF